MNFKDYRDFTGSSPEKFFKSSLFRSENLLLGLNCLEPGQSQPEHGHTSQDKFYFVRTYAVGGRMWVFGRAMPAQTPTIFS